MPPVELPPAEVPAAIEDNNNDCGGQAQGNEIAAVLLMTDPLLWGRELQIVCDVLRAKRGNVATAWNTSNDGGSSSTPFVQRRAKCTTPAQTSPTLPSGPSRGLGVARFDWRWKDFGWSSQQQRHRRRCRKGAAARTVGVLERVAGWKEEWAACPWPKLFTESRSPRSTVSWRRCLRQTWVVIVAVAAIVTMTTTVVVVAVAAAAAAAVVRKTRK
mmetsp:Transcript_52640/g.97853  ORF Transcript_52640/g.97853 Transcript_52640/m.97853 type:complete len:215 (-) Transcript_52640:444-1088(-)